MSVRMPRTELSGEEATVLERLRGVYNSIAAVESSRRNPAQIQAGRGEWEKQLNERCMEEQAMLKDERDKLRLSLHKVDPAVALAVHRNLELCASGIAQMRHDTVRFRQLLEEARLMSQQLDDVSKLHNTNAILESSHMSMGSDIENLKLELAELRTQLMEKRVPRMNPVPRAPGVVKPEMNPVLRAPAVVKPEMNPVLRAPVMVKPEMNPVLKAPVMVKPEMNPVNQRAPVVEMNPVPRQRPPLVLIMGGFNGKSWLNSAELYSPAELRSYGAPPMLTSRSYAASTVLRNNVYVLGGGDGKVWFDTVERYDLEKNCWTPSPQMRNKLGNLAAVTVGDTLYAVGGGNGQDCFADVQCFCPEPGAWLTRTSMLEKRYMVSALELDQAIYAVGGFDGKKYLRSMERYDPRENLWRALPEMEFKRGCFSACTLNGRIYVLGGFDGSSFLSTVEVFDPRAGRWDWDSQPMASPRAYAAGVTVNNSILVLGGLQSKSIHCNTWDVFRENSGWTSMPSQGLERRSFLTAALL